MSDVATFNTQNDDILNNIAGDPMFVDTLNDDFHLLGNSPCIDTGTEGLSTEDYDGNPVPLLAKPDIGAYEYGIWWNGSISHDWHTAGNWSNGQVPTASDSVTIPVPKYYKFYPEVNNNAQVKKIVSL